MEKDKKITVMNISTKLDNVFCKIKLIEDSLANRPENADDCDPVFAGLIRILEEAGKEINELQMINDEIFINSFGNEKPAND